MTKKTKDEARSWLWIGIMCISCAILLVGVFSLIPPEKMSGKSTGYALAAVFFTVGCLIIVFRKNIAQWGTGETSLRERREKPKAAKDKSISGLLLTIGLLSFAGAYVVYKIFASAPISTGLLMLFFLPLGVGILATGAGIAFFILEYRRVWENKTISTSRIPLPLAKVGLLALGIGAVIFTIEFILADIEIRRQYGLNISYWDVILQWPLQSYFTFSNPSVLFSLPFMAYIRLLIACTSPFLALIAARKLEYPPVYHALWFVLVLFFPPLLLILALMPHYSPEIGKRFATATNTFLVGIFWASVGLFLLLPSSGGVVYVVGARWFGTDNPAIAVLSVIMGFLFAGLGIAGIISAILLALGIMKPETLERMFRKFG